jgi:hypothetical protein
LSLENLNLASNGRPLLPVFALYLAINSAQTLGFARASIDLENDTKRLIFYVHHINDTLYGSFLVITQEQQWDVVT